MGELCKWVGFTTICFGLAISIGVVGRVKRGGYVAVDFKFGDKEE